MSSFRVVEDFSGQWQSVRYCFDLYVQFPTSFCDFPPTILQPVANGYAVREGLGVDKS